VFLWPSAWHPPYFDQWSAFWGILGCYLAKSMYPIDWNHCDIDTFLQRLKSLLKRNGVSRVWIDFNWQCQTGLSTAYHSVLINCILEQLIVIQNDLNKVATLAMSVPCQTYCLSSVYVNQCTIWTSVAWVWNFSGYNMHHCIALQVAVIVAEANTAAMKRIIICAKIYCTWWNSVGNLVHIIRVYSAFGPELLERAMNDEQT
jgi:hypothetical protein